jgi:hypothetical protein
MTATDPTLSFMTRKLSVLPECACFEYVGDNPYCAVHGKPAEPATIGEARDVAYGVSELHLDWLDEQATRGCEPYRKVSTEYDEQIPF